MSKLLLISFIVLTGIFAAYYITNHTNYSQPVANITTPSPTPITKLFQSSKTMKFSIEVPSDYKVEEKLTRVFIISPSEEKIYVDRSGTNFNTIEDFLKDLDKHNQISIEEEQTLTINGYQAVRRISKFNSGEIQNSYYIYVNNLVYEVFTDKQSLSNVLNGVAQSFKYTP